jgi:hypothetical protein
VGGWEVDVVAGTRDVLAGGHSACVNSHGSQKGESEGSEGKSS